MASLGKIEIDLVAQLEGLTGNLQKAMTKLEQFGKTAAAAVEKSQPKLASVKAQLIETGHHIERLGKLTEQVGRKLSLFLTAPLAGIGFAAVRAADVTRDFTKQLTGLRNTASEALVPLGNTLLSVFEDFRPAIESALGVLHEISDAFAELPSGLQKTIVVIGLMTAALGPVLLLAGGLISAVGKLSLILIPLASGIASVTAACWPLLAVLAAIGATIAAAFAGFETGGWLFANFRAVQEIAAEFIAQLEDGWTLIKAGAVEAWLVTKKIALEAIDAILVSFNSMADSTKGFLAGLLNAASPGSGAAVMALDAGGGALHNQLAAQIAATNKDLGDTIEQSGRELEDHAEILRTTMANIAADFGNRTSKGLSFSSFVIEDVKSLATKLPEVFEGLMRAPGLAVAMRTFWDRAMGFGSARAGRRDLMSRSQQIDEAHKVTLELYPDEAYREDMKRLEEIAPFITLDVYLRKSELNREKLLKGFGAEILPEQRFRDAMDRLEQLRATGEASAEEIARAQKKITSTLFEESDSLWAKMVQGVESWSDNVTAALAGVVISGKASFKDLFDSFLHMLVQTAIKAAIVTPLVQGLQGFAANVFAGPGYGVTGSYTGWSPGMNRPHAHGGLLTRPVSFPMGGGVTGTAAEHGTEAILPLTRIGADLGVRSSASPVVVQVIDQRRGGEAAQVERSTGQNGQTMIRVLIRDEIKSAMSDGSMDRTMATNFGTARRGVGR